MASEERGLQVVRNPDDSQVASPRPTWRELEQLVEDQYLDELGVEYIDASNEDLFDEGYSPPPLMSPSLAWDRENERYRKAGRRRSSL